MSRFVPLILIPFLMSSPAAGAQTATPRQAPTSTPPAPLPPTPLAPATASAFDLPNAPEVRQQLREVLRGLPPAIWDVLRHDPSLLTNQGYLAPYPSLVAFIARHPEVPLSPGYFIGTPVFDDAADPKARELRITEDVLDGIGALTVIGTVLAFFVWIVRTAVEHRRWLRLSKIQVDAHTKLLDRLTTHEDLLAYVQSSAGRRYLESAPIELDAGGRPSGSALTRVLWAVQAGVVLLAVGIGFSFVHAQVIPESGPGFSIISTLCIALGVGFLASAAAAYAISLRHGLVKTEARATHE